MSEPCITLQLWTVCGLSTFFPCTSKSGTQKPFQVTNDLLNLSSPISYLKQGQLRRVCARYCPFRFRISPRISIPHHLGLLLLYSTILEVTGIFFLISNRNCYFWNLYLLPTLLLSISESNSLVFQPPFGYS